MAQDSTPQIQIHVEDTKKAGVYSNAVSVRVGENDVLLDFGYILPGVSPTTLEVVSRVNLSHKTAEQFLTVLQNSILDHRNKQKRSEQ